MTPDLVVIGAGPAGLAAATEASARGCRVALIDEAPRIGGQIYRSAGSGLADVTLGLASERARKEALFAAYRACQSRIAHHPGTTAFAAFAGPIVHCANDVRRMELNPPAVVLATGVSERGVPFPGWTLPGVMYAGGLQALLKSGRVRPDGPVLLAGAGPLPVAVAAQLVEAGARVAAVALLAPLTRLGASPITAWCGREVLIDGLRYLSILRKARVPVLTRHVPVAAHGGQELESIELAPCDRGARPLHGKRLRFDVQFCGLNYGFTANSELARMAGASHCFDAVRGGWLPQRDELGRTDAEGFFVAGDGAGLRGALVAEAEGRIVGAAAALHARGASSGGLRGELSASFAARRRHQRFQDGVRGLLTLPAGVSEWASGDTVVCRCENVTRTRLERAAAEGHRTLDAIKRNTRAGMGWCGGRTCLASVAAVCGLTQASQPPEPMRARPAARPVSLAALAGDGH